MALDGGDNGPPTANLYGIFLETTSFGWKGYSFDSFREGRGKIEIAINDVYQDQIEGHFFISSP